MYLWIWNWNATWIKFFLPTAQRTRKETDDIDSAVIGQEEEEYDAIDEACLQYEDTLNEEIFFFLYHMKIPESGSMSMPVYRRKWMIKRFVDQKRKENEEVERAKRAAANK